MDKHIWILFALVASLNILFLRNKAIKIYSKEPDRFYGFETSIWIFATVLLGPWLVMGAGMLSGSTQTVWEYLNIRQGGVNVVLFWILPVIILFLLNYWVWQSDDNAKLFADQMQLFARQRLGASLWHKPNFSRIYLAILLVGYTLSLTFLWLANHSSDSL